MNADIKAENLISIIMPAYNSEAYIEDAINSVIDQTYQNWELIVIDDGSIDDTAAMVEKFQSKDSRIVFIKNGKNRGVSATRNRAISLARGSWIAFLDSDDKWDQTKLEKQMKYAKELSAKFVFTGSSYINEDNKPYPGIFEVPEKITYRELRHHNVIPCSSVLVKKHFFEKIKMEKDEIHEDYAVWLRILQTGICAYGINQPLLIYRISKKSKSGNKIKTIKMTYGVFRLIGINPISSVYFTIRHIIGSIKKYKKLGLLKYQGI